MFVGRINDNYRDVTSSKMETIRIVPSNFVLVNGDFDNFKFQWLAASKQEYIITQKLIMIGEKK